jgi:hypothetical protein
MIYLSNPHARGIAEAMWGRGGTSSVRTNRRGAYYFSCSAHGGFVIDANAFTESERAAIDQYAKPEPATVYLFRGAVETYMHPYRQRGNQVSSAATKIQTHFYLFEEDCAWCLPVKFAGITTTQHTTAQAEISFWHWYDPANPQVAHRKHIQTATAAQDPDLIVSASAVGNSVRVWCADGKSWMVDAYDQCRDQWGQPWLSKCENVRACA